MGADGEGGGKVRKAACLCCLCGFLQTQTIALEAAFAALCLCFVSLCQGKEALRLIFSEEEGHAEIHFPNQTLLFLCAKLKFRRRGNVGIIIEDGDIKILCQIFHDIGGAWPTAAMQQQRRAFVLCLQSFEGFFQHELVILFQEISFFL